MKTISNFDPKFLHVMKKYSFLLAFLFLNLTACKKDKDNYGNPLPQQLPPITTQGKNTFGCLVNGEVWLPEVKPSQMFQYPLTSSYQNLLFDVTAKRYLSNENILEVMTLYLNNVNGEGMYLLNTNQIPSGAYGDYINYCIYVTDSTKVGNVEIIKFDITNKIIAGTFEMKLWKDGCDTIHITDGRFDVKYAQ